jgi:hypothetical protein
MRTPILLLLSIACCLAGCATKHQRGSRAVPPPAPPPPPVTNAAPTVEPEIVGTLPDPNKGLSDKDVDELQRRLGMLKKGMTRDQVLQILNLSSFDVKVTSQVGQFGIIYFLEHGHKLLLSLANGADAQVLRWAEFDGSIWPKSPNRPAERRSGLNGSSNP